MADWKKMYVVLCGAISDVLDELPLTAEHAPYREKLQRALEEAEEIYLDSDE